MSGLTPCKTYYYRIRSYNSTDTSGDSNVISVALINNAPTVINKIPDYQAYVGKTINIPISAVNGLIFFDNDPGDVLTVTASKLNGSPLPSFISRSGDLLNVNPSLADTGCFYIVAKASDVCNAFVTDTFRICVDINTASVQIKMKSEYKLYPNPTTGKVRIEANVAYKTIWVTVFNALGSKIFSKEYLFDEPILFDLSGQVPGIYLVRLYDGNVEVSKNLILNKRQ